MVYCIIFILWYVFIISCIMLYHTVFILFYFLRLGLRVFVACAAHRSFLTFRWGRSPRPLTLVFDFCSDPGLFMCSLIQDNVSLKGVSRSVAMFFGPTLVQVCFSLLFCFPPSSFSVVTILVSYILGFLKCRFIYLANWRRSKRTSDHWFSPAGAGPGQGQKPGTSSGCSTRCQGPKCLRHCLLPFQVR